jgi:GNAT superfamily N-acetyltransferase
VSSGDRIRFEPLDTTRHDRNAFSCGVAVLDHYFHRQANQDAKRNVAQSFVGLREDGRVVAYYTLSSSSVPLTDVPEHFRKRLPHYEAIPVTLVGRLAVHRDCRGQGLGKAAMIDACLRAHRAAQVVAAWALIVHAKDTDAAAFYEKFGFLRFEDNPRHLLLPMETIGKALS